MKTITFNIHRGQGFISKAIVKMSLGKFSHASVNFEGTTYESVEGEGFRKTKKAKGSPIVEKYSVKVSDSKFNALKEWSEEQVGKKYDYRGVLAHVFPIFLKPKMGYWYCSEFTFVLHGKIAGVIGEEMGNQKVSPQLFRDIIKTAKQYKQVWN